jgi:hypothetical protein
MDTRIPPTRPDVVTVPSEPRPTPTGTKFSDVLATGATSIVQGAESAMTILPGAPLMALAVRGGTTPAMPMGLGPPVAPSGMGATPGLGSGMATSLVAEVPGTDGSSSAGSALVGGMSSSLVGDGGIQASLMQSQQMNLYFIQVQQQVDAQNRTFTTLSNVLKTENDTVKNAIGNIH